ncbi:MAG TPA: hypothetical protein PLZ86_05430 [bacterium]|nr:hypothetical protein [bacterium]
MSLNSKYTWNDFLKEHPEHREKKLKRTSAEGKKAFEAAYKAFAKKYLSGSLEKLDREIARATKRRDSEKARLVELRKAKKTVKAKIQQKKVGRHDAAIARFASQKEKTKAKQKNI